jgi:hypothetical protein
MNDARIARVAALYRSGTSTDSLPAAPVRSSVQTPERARLWQAELARSMANIERRRPTIMPAAQPVAQAPLRPIPGLLLVAAR